MAGDALERAREAFVRRAWAEARAAYAAVPDQALTLDDLERYATAAHLAGDEAASRDLLSRGYRAAHERDDVTRAVQFAFWVGHSMIFTGEMAQARGWWARARNLLSGRGVDCAEWGLVLFTDALLQLLSGDATAALHTVDEAQAIGRRFAEGNLLASLQFLRGRALIRLGQHSQGMAALDEVMVATTTGETHLLHVGHMYCGSIEACWEVLDLRRAQEWTAALTRWCESQPDLVPYRGPCLVHRVELMRLHGDWDDALAEAQRACDWLSQPASPETPADAFYQLGEVYRLRGDFASAEQAYRQASKWGRSPDPGIALLWLARGEAEAALRAVQRALDESDQPCGARAELLAAQVDILLGLGNVSDAEVAAAELRHLATAGAALLLDALADRAEGSVLVAAGQPRSAIAVLRHAWRAWHALEMPYEGARVRVLIAAACRALGDEASAALELDGARWVYERLRAVHDLAALDVDPAPTRPSAGGGLTAREIEVLRLIAAGETNKGIATVLVISEYTVARHVQNMLQKLHCSSRSSLAVYAVEHGLAHHSPGVRG